MNPGDLWGPYRILHYIGSGAMGEVYFARVESDGREVAVKRVRRSPGPEGAEKLDAERSGAALEKQLSAIDPRVTKVFGYGEIAGDLFIEMEYVDGQDLSTLIDAGPIPPGRAAVIALELCEMLENLRAYETGVIHGDLKPKNIRIDSHDRIRVMDFGVAKALSRTRDHTASLFGSVAYCSPERLDTGSMDANSDLWSVGVMLYQMLAGRLPFEGDRHEVLERRIRSPLPPDPLPTCPAPLSNIVFKMLSRDLAGRYPSASAMHEDLGRFLAGKPVSAPSPDLTVRTIQEKDDDDGTRRTVPPLPPARPLQIALKRLAWTGFAAVLAVFLLAWWLIRPQYLVWADTHQLKRDIETEHLSADTAWDRYTEIMKRDHLPMMTWGIGAPLKSTLVEAGDGPILDFRNNDFVTAREGAWKRSVAYFSHALEVDPSDKTIKGKLRLCEGHLERITAAGPSKIQMLNDAARKFREAADLLKKAPDPYLGLARLYCFNFGDLEQAQQALDQAAKYGHPETRRELATMADGYMRRAAQTARDAQKFAGMPDNERDYLNRARTDYERARDLYQKIGSYGNAADNLIGSIRGVEWVNNKLAEDGLKQ